MPQLELNAKSCPIALSLDRVGEGWTIMILRDAARGLTRFDQFQKSLGIAPNILSLLTERGRDFRPVLWALLAWGNKHFLPKGHAVVLVDHTTGEPVDPTATDQNTSPVKAVFRSIPHYTQARGQS
jgi:DNA-binding HxlR family transcriptional regulator